MMGPAGFLQLSQATLFLGGFTNAGLPPKFCRFFGLKLQSKAILHLRTERARAQYHNSY